MKQLTASSKWMTLAAGLCLMAAPTFANAQSQVKIPQNTISAQDYPTLALPMVICWNNGMKNLYIQTDTSDPDFAKKLGINYVPQLANAINAPNGAVDDIYVTTNSTRPDQYNVIPSQPLPVGPNNTNTQYTPLWQVSEVTWKDGVPQTTLKSEQEVLDAEKAGKVIIVKTQIVINCPVFYTAPGGLLPKAYVLLVKPNQSGLSVYHN